MWDFTLQIDRTNQQALFMQIAKAIVHDISRGRLRAGDRLPGTRTLAAKLGVNRVTVSGAYDELAAEGWIVSHGGRGSFVSKDRPAHVLTALQQGNELEARLESPAYALPPPPVRTMWLQPARGVLLLRSSYPDTRLIRIEPLARAYRRVLRRSGGSLLGYGEPEGHIRLRRAIAQMLRGTRGLAVSSDNIFITRGSQMAIALASRAVLRAGHTVAVEEPGYRYAWDIFRQSGAELAAIPVDGDGLDVEALARVVSRTSVRAVYVTPHHQLPTTVTMSPARRRALLDLAHSAGFVIIEDDYDHEFHYDTRPVAPLASVDPRVVIYVGTLSKVLAPGLRIGYVAAPAPVVKHLAAYRQAIDIQGDPAMESAVAELIEDDEVQRHIRRVKRIYQSRRDLLVNALERTVGDAISFTVPAGGIGLWVQLSEDIDADTWAAASYRRGAAFLTGRAFTIDDRYEPFARLGFACLNEQELRLAVDRLAGALPDARALRIRSVRL